MSADRLSLEEETLDRFENYQILARLFKREVDADLLESLRRSPAPEPTGNERFDDGYAALRSFLDAIEDAAKAKSTLAIDYCAIFLGYGAPPDAEDADTTLNAAYPYESVYRTGRKTLESAAASEVVKTYRSFRFKPDMERIIAEDHMGSELEFLAFLADARLAAIRAGDDEESARLRDASLAFIREHPLAWIDGLTLEASKRAETAFYRGLLAMTRGWLEMDERNLAGEADEDL